MSDTNIAAAPADQRHPAVIAQHVKLATLYGGEAVKEAGSPQNQSPERKTLVRPPGPPPTSLQPASPNPTAPRPRSSSPSMATIQIETRKRGVSGWCS